MLSRWTRSITLLSLCFAAGAFGRGQHFFGANDIGVVNLPFSISDNTGNQWMLQQGGYVQQQGNMPIYSQGGMILSNSQNVQQNNNQARTDEDTGEVIFDNLTINNIPFTRRIKVDPASGMVRMIDIFKNTGTADVKFDFVVQSMFNENCTGNTPIVNTRHKNAALGWVGSTTNQGWRSVVEVYNGKHTKLAFPSGFTSGGNYAWSNFSLPIPAGKEVAIMHLHGTAANQQAGEDYINQLDERKLLADVPKNIRKLIQNFTATDNSLGDLELLRGDVFDVVELAGGDELKGTLKETSYKLTTSFGPVELPSDQVIAMFNLGQFKARQLLVTSDGQVIGGTLEKPTLDLALSSGQVTRIPLSQVRRMGYRKRADEPEEWTFAKPFVQLRGGDRIFVKMPDAPLTFNTRYGPLSVDPKAIALINFQPDGGSVHELSLTDGSTVAGLLGGDSVQLTRDSGGATIKLEPSRLLKWKFKTVDDRTDDDSPLLETTSGDKFVGVISGKLTLETAFDSLQIPGEQIGHIERLKDSASDVQIKLWDGAVVSGKVTDTDLPMTLISGVAVKVPLSMVKEYDQPTPKPSDSMLEQIKTLVKGLNADDWKARDQAEQQITSLGSAVVPVLNDLRKDQSAEVQQRIDVIEKNLANKNKTAPPAGPQNPGANAVPMIQD